MLDEKYGHWDISLVGEFNPEEWFGFIYCITNISNNRKYIGKKQLLFTSRKKIKGKKNRKVIRFESDWKTYTSSSEEVNEDIKKLTISSFTFQIIKLCVSKRILGYSEVEEQFKKNVLTALQENGEREYYNKNIMSRWFVWNEDTGKKVSKIRIEKGLSAGANNPMFGLTGELSPLYGKPTTDFQKQRASETFKNVPKSDEQKKKMSISRTNFWNDEEKSKNSKEALRIHNENQKKLSRGKGISKDNYMTGTMWINDGVINKKIKKTEPLPFGFKKGRLIVVKGSDICKTSKI